MPEGQPGGDAEQVAWKEMAEERPRVIMEVGSSSHGAFLLAGVKESFESGKNSDARYVAVDKAKVPLIKDYRYSIGAAVENEIVLNTLGEGSVDEVWMANIGSIVEKKEMFLRMKKLIKKGAEIYLYDTNTFSLRGQQKEIVEMLSDVFGSASEIEDMKKIENVFVQGCLANKVMGYGSPLVFVAVNSL